MKSKRFSEGQDIGILKQAQTGIKALDLWAFEHKVKLRFIQPGKPVQNTTDQNHQP